MRMPKTVEQLLAELLGIMGQEIPELGSPSSKEAAFSRGRNAEKTATANFLRFHIDQLKITLPTVPTDNSPWPET